MRRGGRDRVEREIQRKKCEKRGERHSERREESEMRKTGVRGERVR